jgi:hypothetical protein
MKKIFLLSVLSILMCSCGGTPTEAEIGQYTTIEVNKTYEGGRVAKGEIIEAKIEVKNTGDYPLVIANIKPACSCTVSDYDEEPIAPGESTVIEANVDTDETGKGSIRKPITISANTRPSTTTVTIKATVIN